MALRPCKECYQKVSTHAKFCPHCGRKNPRQGKISFALGRLANGMIKFGLYGMLIWFLLGLLALLFI